MNVSRASDAGVISTGRPEAGPGVAPRPGTAAALFVRPAVPLLTAVGVAILVVLAISLARWTGHMAALWGASGLAAAMWLRAGHVRPDYDLVFGAMMGVAILAGEFLVGNGVVLSAMFAVANMVEIVLTVVMARRLLPNWRLETLDSVARFLMVSILAPIPAAILAAVCLKILTGQIMATGIQTWWLAHALNIAVVGCALLSATPRATRPYRRPLKLLEAAALMAVLATACFVVFVRLNMPITFLIMPLLLVIVGRLRLLGVSCALVVLVAMAVGGAMANTGPLADHFDEHHRVAMAQLMALAGFLPVVLVAALLDERDALAARARAGQERAERASAAKSRLLVNVAHEIKSPVGGVIGIGEMMARGQLGPVTAQQVEMSDMLVRTARQIETLSHDLLDVARAEAGAVKVNLRPTNIQGLMEDVRRSHLMSARAAGMRLDVTFEGEDLVAQADSQRLSQVLGNFVSNALKYAPEGGVVVLRARRQGDEIRIEVCDRGPGLSLEKQAQLFEPFNRLGLERSAIEGHGVGLALAKRLTELQGGSIGVTSQPGEGACFWVCLPSVR